MKKQIFHIFLIFGVLTLNAAKPVEVRLKSELKPEVIKEADAYLDLAPSTVTAQKCVRSAGGLHDYYSEGTYWWPNPQNPDGPYIQRDGLRNPENFDHDLRALALMSRVVGVETSAYLLSGQLRYRNAAMKHLRAWFVDTATMMTPHLLYAQAIKGTCTGRGIGIIDAAPLIEVALSVAALEKQSNSKDQEIIAIKDWFAKYLQWLNEHPYGIAERNWRNNHGTWWHTQAAAYARLLGDTAKLNIYRKQYKEVILPNQMAHDGSFPEELKRTKPFSYSQFNLDGMLALACLLTDEQHDILNFALPDGRCIKKGVDFLFPFMMNKQNWTFPRDIVDWDDQPRYSSFLYLSEVVFHDSKYMQTWLQLRNKKLSDEGLRNVPLKNPILWTAFLDKK